MVTGIWRALLFQKSFYFFFALFTLSLFSYLRRQSYYFVSLSYFTSYNYFIENFRFLLSYDFFSSSFFFMLLPVSCLVFLYSELYMSHYNNKKFTALACLFVVSMRVLCLRSSSLPLFLGWDGLGVTSICLIIFYPNKVTLFNSLLTMVFNRMGDVLILCALGMLFVYSCCNNFFFFDRRHLFGVLLFFCCFTKRAQFPLSSWLPAAMSAPTPISAIVHSSTLVTAGIFLAIKIGFYFEELRLMFVLSSIRISTFFLGGLIANFESDFKKVVAFSTIRQISIVLVFCSFLMLSLGIVHIILHALFKTLLFCCSGLIFIAHYRDQLSSNLKSVFKENLLNSMLFLAVFIITGFLFSSSFFTKDIFIEAYFNSSFNIFFFFMVGSCLTVLYSIKILSSCLRHNGGFQGSELKNYRFGMFGAFTILTSYSCWFLTRADFLEEFFLLDLLGILLVLSFLVIPLLIKVKPFINICGTSLIKEIIRMKLFLYSYWGLLSGVKYFRHITLREHYIFKPTYFIRRRFLIFQNIEYLLAVFLSLFIIFL